MGRGENKEAGMSRLAPYGYDAGAERDQRPVVVATTGRPAGVAEDGGQMAALLPIARRVALVASLLGQSGLLLIAVIPGGTWESLGFPADGPTPHVLYPVVSGLFYLLPTLTGALCRRWQSALALATLPAWLDLLAFAIGAAGRLGPFDLIQDTAVKGATGTLELFAALGAFGWLARTAVLLVLDDRRRAQGGRHGGAGR